MSVTWLITQVDHNFPKKKNTWNVSSCVGRKAPSKARHDWIRRLPFVPQTITWRISHTKSFHYKKKKRIKSHDIRTHPKETLTAVLTWKQGPSTGVIHFVSAVRPELREPRWSIRGQRCLLPSISKLRHSVRMMKKNNNSLKKKEDNQQKRTQKLR